MLAFSKIIASFLLPPGIFIFIMVFTLIFLFKKKYLVTKILIIFIIILVYILSIEPVKDLFILPLENRYPALNINSKYKDIDYIVVLGGGTISGSPEEEGKSVLTADALKRIVYGAKLYKFFKKPFILSGGIVFKTDRSEPEAVVAKKFLINLKIPASKIFIEDKSRNTWENALKIKNRFSPDKILLVTSAYHMSRSIYCFNENGIECIPCPTDYKGTRNNYNLQSFLPRAYNLNVTSKALKEHLGYIFYKLRY